MDSPLPKSSSWNDQLAQILIKCLLFFYFTARQHPSPNASTYRESANIHLISNWCCIKNLSIYLIFTFSTVSTISKSTNLKLYTPSIQQKTTVVKKEKSNETQGPHVFHFNRYVGELWTYLCCYHNNGNNVNQGQLLFIVEAGLILVQSHDSFTDVTKLVEECGLVDSVLWCHQ